MGGGGGGGGVMLAKNVKNCEYPLTVFFILFRCRFPNSHMSFAEGKARVQTMYRSIFCSCHL